MGDPGSIPGLGRSPEEGKDNPLQYSCLEWMEEPGGLQSTGSQRVGHKVSNFTSLYTSLKFKIIYTKEAFISLHAQKMQSQERNNDTFIYRNAV